MPILHGKALMDGVMDICYRLLFAYVNDFKKALKKLNK
jgi:hypothetical protein